MLIYSYIHGLYICPSLFFYLLFNVLKHIDIDIYIYITPCFYPAGGYDDPPKER